MLKVTINLLIIFCFCFSEAFFKFLLFFDHQTFHCSFLFQDNKNVKKEDSEVDKRNNEKEGDHKVVGADEEEEEEEEEVDGFYNKQKSFFDNISCNSNNKRLLCFSFHSILSNLTNSNLIKQSNQFHSNSI